MPSYTYNGVTVTATRRRPSSRDDKKYERTVTIDGTDYLVHYGDPHMEMQRDNPERRANFLSRHSCDTKRDPKSPGFWACLDWQRTDEKSFDMDNNEDLLLSFGGEIKALGNGKVGGYLVRFTDADNTDLEGDYFTKSTDFGIESGDRLPVYYNHGLDAKLGKRRIGRATAEIEDVGVWVSAQLDMRDEYEKAIYQLVEKGKVGWSSGSMPHLVEREPQKAARHIKSWPLGEASITPTPAAGPQLTQVQPLKNWQEQAVTLDLKVAGNATTEKATATVDSGQTINVTINLSDKRESVEETEMSEEAKVVNANTTDHSDMLEKFSKSIEEKLGTWNTRMVEQGERVEKIEGKVTDVFSKIDQLLQHMQDTPAVRKSGYFTEDGGTQDKSVKSFGDFLLAIKRRDTQRLVKVYNATKDLSGTTGASGGFLVPEEYRTDLLRIAEQQSQILNLVQTVPVNSDRGKWPALDNYITPTAGSGQTYAAAGVVATATAPGGTLTETEPKFVMLDYNINKIGGFTEVENELIEDSPQAIEVLLRSLFGIAIAAKTERGIFRGTGAGEPLGILNAPCAIGIAPDTNNLFAYADSTEIRSRFMQVGGNNSVRWVYHPGIMPDLGAFITDSNGGRLEDLLVFPTVMSQHLPQDDNSGCVILGDFSAYVLFDRTGLSIDYSEHAAFTSDKGTWRFTRRMDGQPWTKNVITLADPQGSYTMSPFVYLND